MDEHLEKETPATKASGGSDGMGVRDEKSSVHLAACSEFNPKSTLSGQQSKTQSPQSKLFIGTAEFMAVMTKQV